MGNHDLGAVFPYQREYRCCDAACLQNIDLAKLTSTRIPTGRNPAAKGEAERSGARRPLIRRAPGEFGTFLPSSPSDPSSCEANRALRGRRGDRSTPCELKVGASWCNRDSRSIERGAGSSPIPGRPLNRVNRRLSDQLGQDQKFRWGQSWNKAFAG